MAAISETVYGTTEEGHVMSEKVSSLATNVYKEFERMIKKYDEDVVKELMPLTVALLEGLDQALSDKQESEVELELLRDDNEQLLTQYEREKQLRKAAEQKYLELEDGVEGQKKEHEEKVESMESVVRMLELKAKNASDHVLRMEEKDSEWKKEYTKLHERYTELFRTHMDQMERTKILMGTDKLELSNSPRNKGFQLPNLRPVSMVITGQNLTPLRSSGTPPSLNCLDIMSPRTPADSNISLKSELGDLDSPDVTDRRRSGKKVGTCDKEQLTDNIMVKEFGTTPKDGAPPNTSESPASVQINGVTDSELSKGDKDNSSQDNSIGRPESHNTGAGEAEPKHTDPPHHIDRAENSQRSHSVETLANTKALEATTSDTTASSVILPQGEDNSVIETTPEKTEAHIATSTPQSSTEEERVRFDSIDHEEAEFEEDRIPGLDATIAHIVATTPELQELEESIGSQTPDSGVRGSLSRRNNDSIFDELNVQDMELGDDFGITGREVTPGDYASSVSDNFFGMGKELENLILENTELLETKNALNIVKDDLIAKVDELSSEQEVLREDITSLQAIRTKLQGRIKDLEDDLKKTKEELEKKSSGNKDEEEDDVPMAQRKRFTRVEMARVLMERNQYKERLMELQEAVRWTEMIRASREHPEVSTTPSKQKKSSIWNLSEFSKKMSSFSNLFSSPNKPTKRPLPMATIKYNAPTTQVQPVGDPNKRTRSKLNLGEKAKAYDFLQDDLRGTTSDSADEHGSSKIENLLDEPVLNQPNMSEKAKKEREKERREQYKQVRAHVKKDDGRLQAYGWSLPAKFQPSLPSKDTPSKSQVPVPVPVYCRPLFDKESGLKIWCAVGVNLTGGRTRDGGSVVGGSVFYSNLSGASVNDTENGSKKDSSKDEVERLNQELKDHEKNLKDTEKEQLSSFVWICTQTATCSRVSIIDANNPGDILETFRVSTSPILCIASVAGALESDYTVDEDILKAESYPQYKPPPEPASDNLATSVTESGIGGITLVQCATGGASGSPTSSPVGSPQKSDEDSLSAAVQNLSSSEEKLDTSVEHRDKADTESLISERSYEAAFGSEDGPPSVFKAKGSPVSSGTATPTSTSSSRSLDRRALQEQADLVRDGISPLPLDSDLQYEETEKMSSVLPTMWLGSQSGSLYVHSSVAQWRRCLHSVKLRDSVLNIVHLKGRVLAALADGTVAIFHRDTEGQWDLQNYHLLDLGRPHHSIRCMTVIANKHVWCGYRNKIHVVDPEKMNIEKTFDAHPRKESQVRQVAWLGDGVWVSIRLDSTLRLYHAYTHVHLQDVDIEPYVSKMLGTGKLGFSFVRITAMLISCNRLWIGTGNGVVISVPLSESNKQTVTTASSGGRPGGIIRVYSDNKSDSVTPGSFIPYCSMAQAQLSFHGHRDAVKFFAAVPVSNPAINITSPVDDTPIPKPRRKRGAARRGMSAVSEVGETTNRHEALPTTDTNTKLVLSGGEGYVDFRIGDGDDEEFIDEEKKVSLSKGDRSHLIVWEVTSTE
ncbi:C-Jun-amino-terminal kinase-interacting protein 4-like isoform X3 [Mizuhopecten yessoensis]|uniref:C-Jun-amino-terminal kinase-interacting protein 4-like isoform X3 n=1 Tax=Mizuhopecten yessoensis TaxID=6573 RepID=UPI000B45EE4B|nr:C-Jun-amino-terminal kinase-interacting protein 4-like isoform X3 [Mizuhopecten yessoensis]